MDHRPADVYYKIVQVGDPRVGRTSLILRYVEDHFDTDDRLIDSVTKRVKVNGKTIELEIHDKPDKRSERDLTINSGSIFEGAHAIIILFDLTDEYSFERVRFWLDEIAHDVSPTGDLEGLFDSNIVLVLAGTKADLGDMREVDNQRAEEMARNIGMDYVEVSAKTGAGVKEMFDALLTKIREKQERGNKASAVTNDYSIRVTSTARNSPEDMLCCNIF